MKINIYIKQATRLSFAFLCALILLSVLLILAPESESKIYAADTCSELAKAPTPSITVTQPSIGDILTQTPQTVNITTNCGSALCIGRAKIEVVSLTLTGLNGPYYHVISETAGYYTYTWNLTATDHITHVLLARARNEGDNIGTSDPVIVYVDTVAPQNPSLSIPTYTKALTFTVAWSATDASPSLRYDVHYRRENQPDNWKVWLTNTTKTSATFTSSPPQTAINSLYAYVFRMRAKDGGNNMTTWITSSISGGQAYLYLPLITRIPPPPPPPTWKQGTGSQELPFRAPSGYGDVWYAGTEDDHGVWTSTDNAQTWSKLADLKPDAYPVIANPSKNSEAFVSVWGIGVHQLNGTNVTPINSGLEELKVYDLVITGTTLYAGTNSMGVYKTDLGTINWQAVNTGISEKRIRSLYVSGNRIYAGSRNCQLYISSDEGVSWKGTPIIAAGTCPNEAQVWSILLVKDTPYASIGQGQGLYYNDTGVWQPTTTLLPAIDIFGLAYDETNDYVYVSTHGEGIYRCHTDTDGKLTTCETHNLELGTLNTREIKIHNDLIVVGSDNGIWYQKLSP